MKLEGLNIPGLDSTLLNLATSITGASIGSLINTIKGDTIDPTTLTENSIFAYGGVTGPSAELEKQEAFELPNGQVGQVNAPPHSEGGIKLPLPDGTKVYSDRIEVDGKTMQKRKMLRERRERRVNKRLESNPSDLITKSTSRVVQQQNQEQDDQDMLTQLAARFNNDPEAQKFATGGVTGIDPLSVLKTILPHMSSASMDAGMTPAYTTFDNPMSNNLGPLKSAMNPPADMTAPTIPSLIGATGVTYPTTNNKLLNTQILKPVQSQPVTLPHVSNVSLGAKMTGNSQQQTTTNNPLFTKLGVPSSSTGGNNMPGLPQTADALGENAQIFGNAAQILNTALAYSSRIRNRNMFENYGKRTLNTMDNAADMLDEQYNQGVQELTRQANTAKREAAGNARNVNTLRALKQGITGNQMQAQQEMRANYSNQLMQNLLEQANFKAKQDTVKMGTDQQMLQADQQDQAALFTNLATNISDASETGQNVAANRNIAINNQFAEDLIAKLGLDTEQAMKLKLQLGLFDQPKKEND